MSDLLTQYSVHDIQNAIIRAKLDARNNVILRNVAWGFFKNIEVDLLSESACGYLTDWEIKRSWSDFLADFRKAHYHDDVRLTHLIYVLPDKLAGDKLKDFCQENYRSFKRTFDIVFYTSDEESEAEFEARKDKDSIFFGPGFTRRTRCELIKSMVDQYANGSRFKVPNPPYTTRSYITEDMEREIERNDRMSGLYRPLFLEEKVKLYRLALVKQGV